jgi:hypothetical protein
MANANCGSFIGCRLYDDDGGGSTGLGRLCGRDRAELALGTLAKPVGDEAVRLFAAAAATDNLSADSEDGA